MIKYKSEYVDEYVAMAANGKTDIQIAAEWGVTTQTIRDWGRKYPDFAQAREIGKAKAEAWWTNYCQAKAVGKLDGDFQAAKWVMMNKFGWSDKQVNDLRMKDVTIKVEFVEANKND